jgi:hypothetical protein
VFPLCGRIGTCRHTALIWFLITCNWRIREFRTSLCKIFEFFISCCNNNLLFPGKEAKSVVPLRGRLVSPELGEADHGGLPPRNGQRLSPSASLNSLFFVIIIKEAKSVVPLRGRLANPELGEADPGGLGACPQETADDLELL